MNNSLNTDNYKQNIIDMYSGVIARRELGFMDKEEVFITNMLSVMAYNAVQNPDLFSDTQYNNIINIVNKLTNGWNL